MSYFVFRAWLIILKWTLKKVNIFMESKFSFCFQSVFDYLKWTFKNIWNGCLRIQISFFFQSVIDYFKMDIEGGEVPALNHMFSSQSLKNIKQFSLELHLLNKSRKGLLAYYSLLYQLEKAGFRRFHYHINEHCNENFPLSGTVRSICHELYYININFI